MEFTNIFKGVEDCNCLEGSSVNITDMFARRVSTISPNDNDFQSYWEGGDNRHKNNCFSKCGYRGVSINSCTEDNKPLFIDKHRKIIAERKKFNSEITIPEFCYFFKFKKDAGKIKQTGEKDITHHDFYKCDTFIVGSSLETIDIINLG
jgi:hypothetical protein